MQRPSRTICTPYSFIYVSWLFPHYPAAPLTPPHIALSSICAGSFDEFTTGRFAYSGEPPCTEAQRSSRTLEDRLILPPRHHPSHGGHGCLGRRSFCCMCDIFPIFEGALVSACGTFGKPSKESLREHLQAAAILPFSSGFELLLPASLTLVAR
ncbi:hypothetical protein P154DRAFT_207664 [Amniculicola lignicola CBS 123094]|uniref:Uncharacterized protein n=1 Tax=Amniculicola lignicola CBS 123094 TaxID=1392246 RepID=A0A6A5WR41_9PLEO|nr:hypothetical protein P154DRAFT_207664 [Amniculicola lignicola CBS 123094]